MSTVMICICGLADSQHGAGMTDHPPVHGDWARGLRDTQQIRKGIRPGHYLVGEQVVRVAAAPAAGVDVKATVPQVGRWKVYGLLASLTTSATVANRIPHLIITDGPPGDTVYNVPSGNNQVATTTVKYAGGPGPVAVTNDNTNVLVLPVEITLLGNWTIGFQTTALQAGDQWTALTLLVYEELFF
jgi:hypothetical protein